jgi:hypothetical protein
MLEIAGVVLILLLAVGLAVRYVVRVLKGAETGCRGCPGCAQGPAPGDGEPPCAPEDPETTNDRTTEDG